MKSFADYEPLTFRFLGMTRHERLPRWTMFHWFHTSRINLKSAIGLPITYFDLRALLTPEQQKNGDMWFLTAWSKKRDTDAENESRAYHLRYWLTTFNYYPELYYVRSVLYSKESPHHKDQPKVDDYMVRWGYRLAVPPSFIELVNGTSSEVALDVVEGMM